MPPILPGKSAAAWSASTVMYILMCVPSGAGKSLSRFGYHRRQILRQGLSAGGLRGFFEKAGVREWGQSEEKGQLTCTLDSRWCRGHPRSVPLEILWGTPENVPWNCPPPREWEVGGFYPPPLVLLCLSVCLFVCLGPHWAACGILVPYQGLNPVPWQWKCWVLTTGPPGNSLILLWLRVSPAMWTPLHHFLVAAALSWRASHWGRHRRDTAAQAWQDAGHTPSADIRGAEGIRLRAPHVSATAGGGGGISAEACLRSDTHTPRIQHVPN